MADIKETTPYDNCIGVKDTSYLDNALPIEMDEASNKREDKEWKKHWVGMPEFVQEENSAYKRLIINFRTKEDYEEFAKLIGQPLTEKTKSTWHPRLDREANSLRRWVEE